MPFLDANLASATSIASAACSRLVPAILDDRGRAAWEGAAYRAARELRASIGRSDLRVSDGKRTYLDAMLDTPGDVERDDRLIYAAGDLARCAGALSHAIVGGDTDKIERWAACAFAAARDVCDEAISDAVAA